jgi:DNA-binding GntR family transcriptional regulator
MPLPEDVPAVHRPAASVLAMQQIQQWIEDGTLQPGEVLKDTEIAAKLGVSRTPIREAFQRLELLGLVVSTRNTRTEVAPARPQDAELLYVPLSVLHELAVQLAIGNLRPEDFDTMTSANERLREAAERGDAVATRQADEEFHAVLLDRTGNPFLVQVIDWLSVHSRRLNTLYFTQDRPTTNSYQDHLEIIAALRDKDEARARQLARDNILRTIDVVQASSPSPER